MNETVQQSHPKVSERLELFRWGRKTSPEFNLVRAVEKLITFPT